MDISRANSTTISRPPAPLPPPLPKREPPPPPPPATPDRGGKVNIRA